MIISQLITKRAVEIPESAEIAMISKDNDIAEISPEKATNAKPNNTHSNILTVLKNTADCKVFDKFPSFLPQNPFTAPENTDNDAKNSGNFRDKRIRSCSGSCFDHSPKGSQNEGAKKQANTLHSDISLGFYLNTAP